MNEQYNQVWKQIDGFSGYMISSFGRIKSKARKIDRKSKGIVFRGQKILTGAQDGEGYIHVRLIADSGKTILWKVHQLVAKVFLNYQRSSENKFVVDHIDSNKQNNRLDNLQIVDNVWNHAIGCNIKAIERRMQPEIYYFEDFVFVINYLNDVQTFKHFIKSFERVEYVFYTRNRISYEQAIKQFKNKGIIQ